MNTLFLKKHWQIILINALMILVFILFYGRFGDPNVDSFREVYIPTQMLSGKILYKNIFNIYAPLSYMINSLLLKVFGTKLCVLYFAGFAATAGIVNLIYLISKKFLPKIYGFGISLLIISTGLLSSNVFNYIFPYSFGILYGMFFILCSMYFCIKKNYTWAYFFSALAICSKYEFLFFILVLFWYTKRKSLAKNLIAFIAPILFICLIFAYQGINFNDILATVETIVTMSATNTIHWFYSISGLIFRWDIVPVYAINFIKILIPLLLVYYFRNIYAYIFAFILLYFFATPAILIFLLPLIVLLLILKYSNLKRGQVFFVISSLAISLKVFFALLLKSYGIFFLPFGLISLLILVPKKIKQSFLIILILLSFVFSIQNVNDLHNKNVKVQTEKGVFYAVKSQGEAMNQLINYILDNVKKEESVVVFPEGLSINVLTARKSDNKLYSLIPLYVETFGEEIIVHRLDKFKPNFIVVSNYDTSNYYYSQFGQDYAANIMEYINNNYTKTNSFGTQFKYDVYKLK